MGRPPLGGAPVFRFVPKEVAEMEKVLEDVKGAIPPRDLIQSLADKFSASPERAGKVIVNSKQVWNWFQNRRYAQKSKGAKVPGKLNIVPSSQDDSATKRAVINSAAVPSGRKALDGAQMEFEAKSARDGAWYDVASFVTHRMFESSDPEVRVRFAGFGAEEDEWVNVKKCVRQRSLPCEASECVAVLPGDLILCFQEGKEQALYFDAHVLDAQRRRHDVRGCRCRFLVRYDHDQSELQEIVPLRKICRRPETDYRLQLLHASRDLSSIELDQRPKQSKDLTSSLVTPFREATRDNFHFLPQMAKSSGENMDVNAQSLSAPMIYPVLHVQEAISSETPSNIPPPAADSTKKIAASEICQPLKMLDSTVDKDVIKPAVQISNSTVEEAVVKPPVQMSHSTVQEAVVKPAVQMSDSTVQEAVVKPAVQMSDSTAEEAVVKPAVQD